MTIFLIIIIIYNSWNYTTSNPCIKLKKKKKNLAKVELEKCYSKPALINCQHYVIAMIVVYVNEQTIFLHYLVN